MAPRHLGIQITEDLHFALCGESVDYRFHVDKTSKRLILDHFGAPGQGAGTFPNRFEFADIGRGDCRLPSIHIRHAEGHTVSDFQYFHHRIVKGKPSSSSHPVVFGSREEVEVLIVYLHDPYSKINADLTYSIFPKYNAIIRSVTLSNKSSQAVIIERAASLCLDFVPINEDWDMTQLHGDWGRECHRLRRPIHFGTQGFQSVSGYSSARHNPFLGLCPRSTTEHTGEAYGFSLIYSGSFSVEVEKFTPGTTRVLMGLNPLHLSWELGPGTSFSTPECCVVYEPKQGFGGMSRSLHNLYRKHLIRSSYALKPRPVLANNWEATGFDFDQERLYGIARSAAELGVSLYVMDDGWFGDKHPRENDHAGLGDWQPNPKRFPNGLDAFISRVNDIRPLNRKANLKFGLWVEPEMVNRESELYEAHPDWVLHAGSHPRTETRNQLVLNLALPEVQDYIIEVICDLLRKYNITYVKWDKNRDLHEMPSPATAHKYMLGLYRCFNDIINRFPTVLFEGCSSGGGRFDPGILYYFPQSWMSDDTDAVERISIQFGATLAYPASAMGCHIAACPSQMTGRSTPIEFRAHVAMMGGGFGLELDPDALTREEREKLPALIDLAERVNPYVIQGDQYRLALPEESNWPAVQYIKTDDDSSVVLAFQLYYHTNTLLAPALMLQGLDPRTEYQVDIEGGESLVASGETLMHAGLKLNWFGDYNSKVIWVWPVERTGGTSLDKAEDSVEGQVEVAAKVEGKEKKAW
ncbi:putative alpha-galactosidase C [Kockovaella imperatae]|uniref:Alpha-galactosidase n=1 Tax=Kockovaella imperatae TaxID=4999 RepID=A0A1Y1U9E2_9TREE|nr:putative alpha-galactosidase C [Kockovaella imperatae]ORX34126.1 putative alpha-galactosidase C [Kockovaella imperatae]